MNSSRLAFLVAILAAAVGAILVVSQHQTNAALRNELRALHAELSLASASPSPRATSAPVASTDPATPDPALAQLRDELHALTDRIENLARVQSAPARTLPALPSSSASVTTSPGAATTAMIPVDAWANQGRATPAAAFQTVLWSAQRGELDTFAHALTFDDAARAKASTLFARLPDTMRAQFGSPEQLMALVLSDEVNKVASMQILREAPQGNDRSVLQVLVQGATGGYKLDNFPLQRGPDGWQLVIVPSTVDGVAKKLTSPSTAATGK